MLMAGDLCGRSLNDFGGFMTPQQFLDKVTTKFGIDSSLDNDDLMLDFKIGQR